MSSYSVNGPYLVEFHKKGNKKYIKNQTADFWKKLGSLPTSKGCYVFGIRSAKGIVPFYVGKATKTFKQEAFTPHKLNLYNIALLDYDKGNPVIFFLAHPKDKGKVNAKEIKEIEKYFIQVALLKNDELLNIASTKRPTWAISGIIRSGQRRPKTEESKFKKMMGID